MRASTPSGSRPEPVHATSPSTTPAPAPVNISINVVVTGIGAAVRWSICRPIFS
jgi:hypothetical protein